MVNFMILNAFKNIKMSFKIQSNFKIILPCMLLNFIKNILAEMKFLKIA